jgi:pimeloyl-ACP methyl ester carboxylesterase
MKPSKRDYTFLDPFSNMIFYPRKPYGSIKENEKMFSVAFTVDENIQTVGRFYKTEEYKKAPVILFFHGNGEIAADYDFIGPTYQQMGVNFFVADYRGYGLSDGTPSFSNMINDAHKIFHAFVEYLPRNEFLGPISVMGRSLGSASAIDLVAHYQDQLTCLIIESGFAYPYNLLQRLGIPSSALPPDKESEVSPLKFMESISIPTLVIHGERDMIIPLEDGVALYRNVQTEEKELLIIPQAGHNDLLLHGSQDYMAAIQKIIFESS